MSKITAIICFLYCCFSFSQEKLVTKTGIISFESADTSFEDVKAINKGVTFVLNTKTGEIASLALMKEFQFKIALMEEHFNESYAESTTYPKAIFRGKIVDFDLKKLTAIAKEYTITGNLEIHGKVVPITSVLKIKKTLNGIEISSNFNVATSDFNIKSPKMSKNSNASKVNIATSFVLK